MVAQEESQQEMEPYIMRVQAFYATDVALKDAQLATVSPNELTIKSNRNSEWRRLQRRRLIEIAANLFSLRGYSHTSLREIARVASCHERAIRDEFGGKLALLEEAIRERITDHEEPRGAESSTLEEEIGCLTVWQVNRMRRQKHCLEAFLPQDRFNQLVCEVAGRLSVASSTEILRERLSALRINDAGLDFLVVAIQAVGLSLGWNGLLDHNHVSSKVRQVASVLAAGVRCSCG
jgi:AcrR family transcriptional regulator